MLKKPVAALTAPYGCHASSDNVIPMREVVSSLTHNSRKGSETFLYTAVKLAVIQSTNKSNQHIYIKIHIYIYEFSLFLSQV